MSLTYMGSLSDCGFKLMITNYVKRVIFIKFLPQK